jgi:dCTP diphosphatase
MGIVRQEILDQLLRFRHERDWEKFHTSRNLATAISVEAAELLECFQWASDDQLEHLLSTRRVAIEDEIADIAILLSYLCHDLAMDIDSVVEAKLEKNRAKYPLHLARGNATKYDRL